MLKYKCRACNREWESARLSPDSWRCLDLMCDGVCDEIEKPSYAQLEAMVAGLTGIVEQQSEVIYLLTQALERGAHVAFCLN